jgi:hypothetical protein
MPPPANAPDRELPDERVEIAHVLQEVGPDVVIRRRRRGKGPLTNVTPMNVAVQRQSVAPLSHAVKRLHRHLPVRPRILLVVRHLMVRLVPLKVSFEW